VDKWIKIGFLSLLFSFPFSALAVPTSWTELEPEPTLTSPAMFDYSATSVYGATVCPNGSGNALRIKIYSGSYPDTSSQEANPVGGTCFNTGWDWFTSDVNPIGTNPLALTHDNGSALSDGDYWVEIYSDANPSYYTNFSISGGSVVPDFVATSTPGILGIAPSSGSLGLSSPVTFTITVYNDSADYVRLTLENLSTGLTLIPLDIPLLASGYTTVSTTTSLVNGFYFGSVSALGTTTIRSMIYSFTVGASDSLTPLPNLPPVGSSIGTSSLASSTNLLGFLNVPELLKTKVPFAYLFEIAPVLRSFSASSSPSSISDSTFDITLPVHNGTTSLPITLFSTSTVGQFLPSGVLVGLRALMVAVTYIGTGMFLFHDARAKRHLF